MRIVNPVDQESLKYGVEAAGRDLLKELPALTKGQVIIFWHVRKYARLMPSSPTLNGPRWRDLGCSFVMASTFSIPSAPGAGSRKSTFGRATSGCNSEGSIYRLGRDSGA